MTKNDRKEFDRMLALASIAPTYAANSLAVMSRCATAKDARMIGELIGQNPALARLVEQVNGCYVPRTVGWVADDMERARVEMGSDREGV